MLGPCHQQQQQQYQHHPHQSRRRRCPSYYRRQERRRAARAEAEEAGSAAENKENDDTLITIESEELSEASEDNSESVEGAIADKEAEEVSITKEETVVDQTETVEGDETVVETVAKSKVLNVAPPEEVPESFSEYLSDSTATAEEGGDKSAAVPTSVIQSVPKADTEKEEAENLEENPDGLQRFLSERTSSRPWSTFTSNSWRCDAT